MDTIERKKIVLLDVDEVICFSGFLPLVNSFLGTNYTIDECTNYYIDEEFIPKERMDEFNEFIKGKNMYENAHILPGAVEAIKRLNDYYDIYFLSSCINPFDKKNSGYLFLYKFKFLIENFPFIDPNKYIFTSSKDIIKGDVKVDDCLSNLKNNIKTKILFPSYHNKNIPCEELGKLGVVRAGYDWRLGWQELEEILMSDYHKKRIYKP